MAPFFMKSNFFEFNGKVKEEISGTAFATKRASTYVCIYERN